MAIQPKDLNQENRRYGNQYRQNLQGEWEGHWLPFLEKVVSYYNDGHYSNTVDIFQTRNKGFSCNSEPVPEFLQSQHTT